MIISNTSNSPSDTENSIDELAHRAQFTLKDLPLNEIHPPETVFYSPGQDSSSPPANFPIIVRKVSQNSFVIIDGVKRYRLLLDNTVASTPCMCTELDEKSCTLLRISLNSSRPRTLEEKIATTRWLRENYSAPVYSALCDRVQITPKERHELEVLNEIDSSIIRTIDQGYLDFTLASDIQGLASAERDSIMSLFTSLPLTRQNQREFLQWVPELACRENTTIEEVISQQEVQNCVSNKTLNNPQKVQKLRDYFYHRRFPLYWALERKWKAKVRQINPEPSRVQFIPSPGFEKRKLELKITLHNGEMAKNLFSDLSALNASDWEDVLLPSGDMSSE